ncbi:tetratricopeptide repeat protein [Pseudomonas citronellolis]|uniref:tetratricopeptide repeat protein n=1 Tax=Pseudomonas citronellolis TaxID=53408 RepID=UPI000E2E6AFE|nr:tetratricopeptide repeat protein [Pseudomonas citronellolis]
MQKPAHKKDRKGAAPARPTSPPRLARRLAAALVAVLLLASAGAWWYVEHSAPSLPVASPPAPPAKPVVAEAPKAGFVDEQQCQGCHQGQFQDWQGSHHHKAMQVANEANVLGDFADARFKGEAESTRFFRKGEEFWVNTPGADGKPADFKVAYTFGVAPLQQYLLEYPGGRLQALGVAWDTQKQRWFELNPGQHVDFKDELHWTRPTQNANFMCIECHTTEFKRNFDADKNTFASHWQSLGVGCQACHGPASRHLEWAQKPDGDASRGFDRPLGASTAASELVENCARCHARRAPLGDGFQHRHRFMDDYLPSLLTRELYQIDGKIKDEVFEWGSFTQSKMFEKGVKCTDCHNPHSGQVKIAGNGLCLQCHNPAGKPVRPGIDGKGLQAKNYDSPEHHHHQPGTPGAQCTACHMPGKYYMVNHYRHDHSFSIPDPQHAQKIGAPDACMGCHRDSASKVSEQFRLWYASDAKPAGAVPRYDDTLWKARNGQPGASRALHLLLASNELPAIRRATLLAELPAYPSSRSLELAGQGLQDADPLVRNAAIGALAALAGPPRQALLLAPLLDDPLRAVRLSVTWQLAQLPPEVRAGLQAPLAKGLKEYEEVQLSLAERAESNLNRAMLYQVTGRDAEVEPALRAALVRDPDFLPALVSLYQWLEARQRPDEARQLLDGALKRHPQSGLLHHALGLALIRQGQRDAALKELQEAVRLAPDSAQFRYILAIGLHDSGQADAACRQLEQLLQRHPANRDARLALIAYLREIGQLEKVQMQLAELEQQNPDDPALKGE